MMIGRERRSQVVATTAYSVAALNEAKSAWELLPKHRKDARDLSPFDVGFAAATVCLGMGRQRAARAWCHRLTAIEPVFVRDAIILCTALYGIGKRTRAAEMYHAIFDSNGAYRGANSPLEQPFHVDVASLAGKRVMVKTGPGALNGFGNILQDARYLGRLRPLCGRLIVRASRPLVDLFANAGVADEISDDADRMPDHDAWLMLSSLPQFLSLNLDGDGIGQNAVYLPSPAKASRALCGNKPRVALSWAGNPSHPNDQNRSLPHEVVSDLVRSVPEVTWVGIQVGERSKELAMIKGSFPEADIELRSDDDPAATTFERTAELLETIDLVITVDSSPAHLAGSMGIPTWTILPPIPDPRWEYRDTESTALYPGMRLIRRGYNENWMNLSARLATTLRNWTQTRTIESSKK